MTTTANTWQELDASFAPAAVAPDTTIGRRGRDYSLAFLALADALDAEPPSSVLATSLGDHRADAILVAAGTAVIGAQLRRGRIDLPSLRLVERAIRSIDASLDRLPLRVTTYRSARDALRAALHPLLSPSPCVVVDRAEPARSHL